jgi:hypothetical protein
VEKVCGMLFLDWWFLWDGFDACFGGFFWMI